MMRRRFSVEAIVFGWSLCRAHEFRGRKIHFFRISKRVAIVWDRKDGK